MRIEICQHMIDNKLTFEIKINRKSRYKVVNDKPCLFKGLNVFAGVADTKYPTASGKIRNLYYETSDKINKGKCVVDFRSCTGPVRLGRSHGKGSYPPMKGGYFFKKTEKYIQKNEIDLKANNLITVLPNLGSEYKIIFDVLINKYKRNTWYTVLFGTADKHHNGYGTKYGDRLPAVWVYNDFVWTAVSINDNPNLYHAPAYVTVGKWMKIEICQHMIDNKLTFEVKINRRRRYTVVNKKPCLFKGVNVFAGLPDTNYPTAPGKIKNLYYETSDEANKGQCVVDFRSCTKPVSIGRLTHDWNSTSVFCYKNC